MGHYDSSYESTDKEFYRKLEAKRVKERERKFTEYFSDMSTADKEDMVMMYENRERIKVLLHTLQWASNLDL